MRSCKRQSIDRMNLLKIRTFFLIIILLKGWERLISPGIWAEDGTVFLKQAFEHGLASLFLPYDGYFHTLPRIIAVIVTWIPVKLIPIFIVFFCYCVFVYTITFFFAPSYKWIFRSQPLTFVAALILLLAPGQIEMLGNLTNLHWYLLLLLSVLALKDIHTPYTFSEIVIAFLCISTSGTSIILLPIFVLRIILKWKEKKAAKYGEYLIVFIILLFFLIHIIIATDSSLFIYPFSIYLKIYLRHFFFSFVFPLFLGDYLTLQLHSIKIIYSALTIILISFVSLHLSKDWDRLYILIITLSICSLWLPVMITIARPLSMLTILNFSNYDMHYWFNSRYSFYIPAIASIFWMFVICRKNTHWTIKYSIITLFLFSQLLFNYHRIVINKYSTPTDWVQKADQMKESFRTGCPKTTRVNIAPSGWYVDFVSTKPNDCEINEK